MCPNNLAGSSIIQHLVGNMLAGLHTMAAECHEAPALGLQSWRSADAYQAHRADQVLWPLVGNCSLGQGWLLPSSACSLPFLRLEQENQDKNPSVWDLVCQPLRSEGQQAATASSCSPGWFESQVGVTTSWHSSSWRCMKATEEL